MSSFRGKLAKFFDELALAFKGLLLATKQKSFWLSFLVTFFVFGLLINLLSNGFSSFRLIFSGNLSLAWKVLSGAFLGIFGIEKSFLDFFLNFVLILFQSILIALVFFVREHNKEANSSATESSAIVAGLAVLGSGCPTCGTTLLAPVLGAILSGTSGAVAVAGKISLALNFLAILLAFFVFKKLGFETYAIIKSDIYHKKKGSSDEKAN